jgi:hypothetical protein
MCRREYRVSEGPPLPAQFEALEMHWAVACFFQSTGKALPNVCTTSSFIRGQRIVPSCPAYEHKLNGPKSHKDSKFLVCRFQDSVKSHHHSNPPHA